MAQRLGHPQARLPDNLQDHDDEQHLRKQGQWCGLFGGFDLKEQLRRDELGQIDCQTDKEPRQKDAEVKCPVFEQPHQRRKDGGGGVIVKAIEVFAKKAGQNEGRRTAVDQNDKLPLTELGGGHGGALGIADGRKQAQFGWEEPGQKIAGIQQQGGSCFLQRLPHPGHSGGVGLIPAVAQGIFRLHGAIRLRHLLHQRIGANETAQQAQIDPQKIREALPGAPQAAFPAGLLH